MALGFVWGSPGLPSFALGDAAMLRKEVRFQELGGSRHETGAETLMIHKYVRRGELRDVVHSRGRRL
jgi:hypothetical protein